MMPGLDNPLNNHHTQNVLIVENKVLLGASIQILLADKNFKVSGFMPQTETELIVAIWSLRPDVVILNEESRLTTPTQLLTQLKTYPNLRLIVVDVNRHTMKIYDQRELKTSSIESLTLAIKMTQREIFDIQSVWHGKYSHN